MGVDVQRLTTGDRLGDYCISATLGRGSFATVYLARDERTGKRVAVKAIAHCPEGDADSPAKRLRHEIEILQRLDHPRICRVFELGREQTILFLAMEYIDGCTLEAEIRRVGKIPASRLLPIVRQICEGVSAAHEKKVLHRDIKPSNIMLSDGDHVTLLDFGHAIGPDISRITAVGSWVGTLQYAAPELLHNKPSSVQSDIYSIGAVMWRCLTGQMPFAGRNYGEVTSSKLYQEPRPLATVVPDLAPELCALVAKAMHRDCGARFSGARELASSVEALGGKKPSVSLAKPASPSAAPPAASPHESYVWYVDAIRTQRLAKGIAPGDLAKVDALERAAAFSASEGQIDNSLESLRQALEELSRVEIDRTFTSQKIQRFEQALRNAGGYRQLSELSPILEQVMRNFDEGRFVEANRALNQALSALDAAQKKARRASQA